MNKEQIDKILDSVFEKLDSMTNNERIELLKSYGIDVIEKNEKQETSSNVKVYQKDRKGDF